MTPFEAKLNTVAKRTETLLEQLLSEEARPQEVTRPARLAEAMRYGALNGGKRLRPFLVFESAAMFGGDEMAALRVGAALECLHSYSLVHDDLPAMDDDDLRRGKPTVHIAYDEATAILAGDALLTYAFDIIAAPETQIVDRAKIELVLALARAAGVGGMAGGQALDLAAEKQAPDVHGIVMLQAMKTGALIRFACEAGAVIAGASEDDRDRMRRFGEIIGRAFQLADDLLDLTSDAATLGKAAGKDAARGKGTLVALRGQAWVEAELDRLVDEASALIAVYGERAATLIEAARFVANRKA
ncbi:MULTISPECIES: polyprenyl synthetase family protein [Alphaproteobacteria]|uniref:Geranylgeranyl pyrophosphate synthase n=2 Tax=Alphaproteobacteria TaxID=28211 RepID=A0ABQ6EAL9_9SPHN|nr:MULTISPECIES: farnesyl diphosphate synthase [Alphaproteobacteria]GEO85676.1 geranylgeranyl pyrophosphate synthase [Ciceribacter naphthalenivorans]GLR21965.1 geranylgeranyl pyrophosphate synthase [Ciceribacter naphthalenivorans]GLT04821.1 geranylgeranyl pyrophosphate synthase [Sphingomonas psychrolutea]